MLNGGGGQYVQKGSSWGHEQRNRIRNNKIDTIQVAYKKTVYILHFDNACTSLPPSLIERWTTESIKKVGRGVSGDLARIARSYGAVGTGALELGPFCSARKCIPTGTLSLSEISSIVLSTKVSKDERLSTWNCERLSDEQQSYAAIDTWAGLALYDAVKDIAVSGKRLLAKDDYLPGTFVALKPPRSKAAIAYGEIIVDSMAPKLKRNMIMVKILVLKVPGYVLPRDENSDSASTVPLDSLGDLPITVNLYKNHLITGDRAKVMGESSAGRSSSFSLSAPSGITTTLG